MPLNESKPAGTLGTDTGHAGGDAMRTVYIYRSSGQLLSARVPFTTEPNVSLNKNAVTTDHGAASLTQDELLAVSQCKTLLSATDAQSLTHDSMLSSWMDAWDRAGILDSVMTAALGDIELAKKTMRAHRMSIDEVPVRTWPTWGLRSLLEEQRIELNRSARNQTAFKGSVRCSISIAQCSRLGESASLIEWIRVWQGTKTRNAVFASLAGVGHCLLPESISQCEMENAEHATTYRIGLFSPFARRNQVPTYVLSGHLKKTGNKSVLGYHPLTREQIPSIDVNNWMAGHRLSVTHEADGSHPFDLITKSSGRSLSELDGWHVMGLHIRMVPSSVTEKNTPPIYDVLTGDELSLMGTVVANLKAPSPETRAMPGVYPKTWIVDCTLPSKTDLKNRTPSLLLCRRADAYELIVNNWLLRAGSNANLPMHRYSSSFRSAKWRFDSGKYLLCPAGDFATVNDYGSILATRAFSNFRMPLGSLIGTGIKLQGVDVSGDCHLDAGSAFEALLSVLSESLANPMMDLNYLMHWLVFDSVTGFLAQMPYRYQVVYMNSRLVLSPIPFWSLDDQELIRASVANDFGYRVEFGAEDAASYLSGNNLAALANMADMEPIALLRFRAACLEALLAGADGAIAKLEAHAVKNDEMDTDAFRTAKSKIEWIKSRA